MNCCYGMPNHTYGFSCLLTRPEPKPEPLAPWERELLGYAEGEGCVTFTRMDGQVVVIDNVRVDSIGPRAENPGVIGVESFDDEDVIHHVPFVKFWTISY